MKNKKLKELSTILLKEKNSQISYLRFNLILNQINIKNSLKWKKWNNDDEESLIDDLKDLKESLASSALYKIFLNSIYGISLYNYNERKQQLYNGINDSAVVNSSVFEGTNIYLVHDDKIFAQLSQSITGVFNVEEHSSEYPDLSFKPTIYLIYIKDFRDLITEENYDDYITDIRIFSEEKELEIVKVKKYVNNHDITLRIDVSDYIKAYFDTLITLGDE